MIAERPDEFKSEEIWLGFLPRKAFIIALVFLALAMLLFKAVGIVGFLIVLVVGAVVVALTMIHVSDEKYLKGAGLTLDTVLIRKYIRKKNKKILVKGCEDKYDR